MVGAAVAESSGSSDASALMLVGQYDKHCDPISLYVEFSTLGSTASCVERANTNFKLLNKCPRTRARRLMLCFSYS